MEVEQISLKDYLDSSPSMTFPDLAHALSLPPSELSQNIESLQKHRPFVKVQLTENCVTIGQVGSPYILTTGNYETDFVEILEAWRTRALNYRMDEPQAVAGRIGVLRQKIGCPTINKFLDRSIRKEPKPQEKQESYEPQLQKLKEETIYKRKSIINGNPKRALSKLDKIVSLDDLAGVQDMSDSSDDVQIIVPVKRPREEYRANVENKGQEYRVKQVEEQVMLRPVAKVESTQSVKEKRKQNRERNTILNYFGRKVQISKFQGIFFVLVK